MIYPLWPQPGAPRPLIGCYLDMPLRDWQQRCGRLLLYSNYVSSLDGRIAIRQSEAADYSVPSSIANARDWRLYQELAAHADVLITSGRFYRQWAQGRHQGEQPVGTDPAFADIRRWRLAQGYPAQPDILIVSSSLALPTAALMHMQQQGRRVLVACSQYSPKQDMARLRELGIIVQPCGDAQAEGRQLADFLQRQGYRLGCMLAGPGVHSTLLCAGVLDYLFLTLRHQLVGYDDVRGITTGQWPEAIALRLKQLLHDPQTEQLFACYQCGVIGSPFPRQRC